MRKYNFIALISLILFSSIRIYAQEELYVSFRTTRLIGDNVEIFVEGPEHGVMIDLGDGNREEMKTGQRASYTLKGQVVKIYGNITGLDCAQNDITEIDLKNNRAIGSLNCSNNHIRTLDVVSCQLLGSLVCNSNELKELDLYANQNLVKLQCDNNKIESLDLSKNSRLQMLQCSSNALRELNLANNKELQKVLCFSNQISSLNLRNLKDITILSCMNNKISSLDLSNNTKLSEVYCSINKLSDLDLSAQKNLLRLDCSSNQLNALKIYHSDKLNFLSCHSNRLSKDVLTRLVTDLNSTDNPLKEFRPFDPSQKTEANLITYDLVKKAKQKGWACLQGNGNKELTFQKVSITTVGEGNLEVVSQNVDDGYAVTDSYLKLKAVPDKGYELTALTANDVDIMKDMGCQITKLTEIVAEFKRIDAVEDVVAQDISICQRHGLLLFSGLRQGAEVMLYSLDGALLVAAVADANGSVELNAKDFCRDRVLVCIPAIKFVKKISLQD